MKHIFVTLIAIVLSVGVIPINGQELQPLEKELRRLKTKTALVLPSQAIDDYPLWSPGADFVAVNVAGKWLKVDLKNITLGNATWRGKQAIGVIKSRSSVQPAAKEEIAAWKRQAKWDPRIVTTSSGTKIELRETDMGVSLIIAKKGQKAQTLWSTDMENCHSVSISPGEHFVAFLSETNGAVVMQLLDE